MNARQSVTSAYLITKLGYTPENVASKGVANGYAALDAGAHLPSAYLTTGILTGVLGYTPANKAGDTLTGKLVTLASAAGGAGLNLPAGAAPTTPANGDVWNTGTAIQWRVNGSTRTNAFLEAVNTFSTPQHIQADLGTSIQSILFLQNTNTNQLTGGTRLEFQHSDTAAGALPSYLQVVKSGDWTSGGGNNGTNFQVVLQNGGTTATVMTVVGLNQAVLINTITDDGINKLQVNGGIKGTTLAGTTLNLTNTLTGVAANFSGKVTTPASSATTAGLNIGAGGTAPTTPVNGDLWFTGTNLQYQLGNATRSVAILEGTNTFTAGQVFSASNSGVDPTLPTNIPMIARNSNTAATGIYVGIPLQFADPSAGTTKTGGMYLVKNGTWTTGTTSTYNADLVFYTLTGDVSTRQMTIVSTNGHVLIGTAVDDGVNMLQVNDSGKFANNLTAGGILTLGSGATAVSNAAGNLLSSALTGALPALDGSALTNLPYDISGGYTGTIPASTVVAVIPVVRSFTIPSTGHQGTAKVAATASTTFTFKKNGTSFGTMVWAASGTVPTFTITATSFVAGDVIELDAPASADATLADIGFTLFGHT